MNLQVRRAGAGDAAIVALLGRVTFGETFGPLFGRHRSDLRTYLDTTFGVSKIERSLDHPDNTYWLATVDRLPAGYAKLKLGSPPPGRPTTDAAQLQKIYVLREFLGQQVGALLMRAVLEAASHAPLLWLDVLHENARAIAFYERFGFGAIGEDSFTIGAQTFRFRLMGRVRS